MGCVVGHCDECVCEQEKGGGCQCDSEFHDSQSHEIHFFLQRTFYFDCFEHHFLKNTGQSILTGKVIEMYFER